MALSRSSCAPAPPAFRTLTWAACIAMTTGAVATSPATGAESDTAAPAALHVLTLDNGTTILFQHIPGAGVVGLEALYPVGLIHDPAGITQGSHLLEHIMCMAATGSHAAGESYALLGSIGMGNAETMGDMTHYDLVVPPDDFQRALEIIAERQWSLRVNADVIAQEAPRCAAEVDGVTQALGSPGFKFSLAAAAQHWRHGRTELSLAGELGGWTADALGEYHARTCTPDHLVVSIAGDLDRADVEALSARVLGRPPAGLAEPAGEGRAAADLYAPIDWNGVPREGVVRWDSNASAVFVAYPPPTDPEEQLALTIWSTAVFMRRQGALTAEFQQPMLSTNGYPVGDLPLLAFAAVADGASSAAVGERLARVLEDAAAAPDAGAASARQMARSLARSAEQGTDEASFQRGLQALTAQVGRDQAESMMVGNIALQTGLMWQSLGPHPRQRLTDLQERDGAWWEAVIRRTVSAERRIVTRLDPR